jgi:dipeptidyl aminopeptidase/acylaminoacyl peptidase
VAREDSARPRDIWIARPAEEAWGWRQLTRVNRQLDTIPLAETRTLHWTGAEGWPIQGLLVLPVGYRAGMRVPMVLQVHGGPANLWPHRFQAGGSQWAQLLAAHGMAVLLPNPRGSTGWGREFAEANLGDMGGKDWEDILAGADHCIELGIAAPDRLGLGGWSYGGFMAALGVTLTSRFKAAVMGAGISHWRSFHGVSDIPTWDALFYRASPYVLGNEYDRFSAIHGVARVTTPTLILHGEKDTCVPVGQAYEFYRGLKEHGVETELVVYPREGHGVVERKHQEDLQNRVLDWFRRHLLPQ